MDNDRKSRYLEKLTHLKRYYSRLILVFNRNDLETIKKKDDFVSLYAIYHLIQLCLEVIADLSAMMVKDLAMNAKDDYRNYTILHEQGIIDNRCFTAIKDLNGLRNRIVHEYNGLIDEKVWESMNLNHTMIEIFRNRVEEWLQTQK